MSRPFCLVVIQKDSTLFLSVQTVQAALPSANRDSESVVFNSGQKMALRAVYVVIC